MSKEITKQKLEKYFSVTGKAIEMAKKSKNRTSSASERKDFLDMVERYYSDAKFFSEKGDYVNAFASLNYCHGWLDAGARIGLFDVHDSKLFTVDDK
jgi:hypothetical protein